MATYATLLEIKEYLNITTTDTDDLIYTFIKSASKSIDDFVGYTFEVEYGSDETLYNVKNLDMLVLRKYPIVGISSIESGVDYVRRDDEGIIVLDNTYTGDFSLSVSFGQSPPWPVKTACMELVNLMWRNRQMTGMKKMTMGDYSVEVSENMNRSSEMRNVLNQLIEYRDLNGSVTKQIYNQMR